MRKVTIKDKNKIYKINTCKNKQRLEITIK